MVMTVISGGFTTLPGSSDLRSIASQRMTAPATISPRSSSSKLSSPSISLPSTKSVLELGFGSLCRWSKLKGLGFQFVLKSTNLSSNRREIEGAAGTANQKPSTRRIGVC
ncbi:hypothetical protein LXL04_021855 [Taraxacum kok-saghyz]